MKHIMVDCETWGTYAGVALRSIGAVAFELDGPIGQSFYLNVSDPDGLREPSTEKWWQQFPEANAFLDDNPYPLGRALDALTSFWESQSAKFLWCHGANFDSVLLEERYRSLEAKAPWKFFNVRCTRTWYHSFDFDPRSIPFEGIKHHARDDAMMQVKCVQAAWRNRK